MYRLEKDLVSDFLSILKNSAFSSEGQPNIITEFNYQRGRPDVIALLINGELVAFEAKLNKWRTALDQAYRNTCFAHFSYIILPEDTALKALKYTGEFKKRSVGICFIRDNKIVVGLEAAKNQPIQRSLSRFAIEKVIESNGGILNANVQ